VEYGWWLGSAVIFIPSRTLTWAFGVNRRSVESDIHLRVFKTSTAAFAYADKAGRLGANRLGKVLKKTSSEPDLASRTGNQFFFGHAGRHLNQFQSVLGDIQHTKVSDDAVDDTDASEWQVAVLEQLVRG
jgi:hypothetical protein